MKYGRAQGMRDLSILGEGRTMESLFSTNVILERRDLEQVEKKESQTTDVVKIGHPHNK